MSRNFYAEKDFTFRRNGDLIVCERDGEALFCVFDDGTMECMANAFMQGREKGEKIGRAKLQAEMRALIGSRP